MCDVYARPLHAPGWLQGEWDHGVRQGKGTMTWARSGQVFEGMFYAGQRHGHGVQTSAKTGISFDGEVRVRVLLFLPFALSRPPRPPRFSPTPLRF